MRSPDHAGIVPPGQRRVQRDPLLNAASRLHSIFFAATRATYQSRAMNSARAEHETRATSTGGMITYRSVVDV